MKRSSLCTAVLVSASVLLAACGGGDDDTASSSPGGSSTPAASAPDGTAGDDIDRDATLRFGLELAGRVGFDGITAGGGYGSRGHWMELLYDTMIRDDEQGNPVAGLATEWSSPDDFTVDLTLREGVTFHDGTPFDADAVKWSWDRCIADDNHTKLAEHAAMESVDVIGPLQVRLHLSEPLAGAFLDWTLRTANYCMGIVSPTAVQTLGDAGFEAAPVGAGPYRFVSYETDQKMVFERVDDYWSPGYFQRIEIVNSTPGPTVVTSIASGEFDVGKVDAPDISQAEAAGLDVVVLPSEGQNYLYLCSSNPALADVDARHAIAKAIDQDELNEVAFQGRGSPNEVIIPKEKATHAADLFGGINGYDLEEAKRLADESGLTGQTLDLMLLATNVTLNALGEVIQQQLKEIGVTVDIVPTQNPFADKVAKQPAMEIWSDFTFSGILEPGGVNNYCNNTTPEVSDAYAQVWRTSLSPEESQAAWHQYQLAVQETAPIIPLVTDVRAVVHQYGDRLHGIRLKQTSYVDLRLLYLTKK